MHHPKFVQSSIVNDCLKVKTDGHTKLQLFPKLLLQVSVIELPYKLVSAKIYGGIKEERDEDNNIIISESTLRSLFPTQFKRML